MDNIHTLHLAVIRFAETLDEVVSASNNLAARINAMLEDKAPASPQAGSVTTVTHTLEDVRGELKKVMDLDTNNGLAKTTGLYKILGKHGAKRPSELDPKHYAAVIEQCRAYLDVPF